MTRQSPEPCGTVLDGPPPPCPGLRVRGAMAPAAAMRGKRSAAALAFVAAVLALRRGLLARAAAPPVMNDGSRSTLPSSSLAAAAAAGGAPLLLLARREELGVARQIGLRVAGAEGRLLPGRSEPAERAAPAAGLVVAVVEGLVARRRCRPPSGR